MKLILADSQKSPDQQSLPTRCTHLLILDNSTGIIQMATIEEATLPQKTLQI
jgi:putative hemolysin